MSNVFNQVKIDDTDPRFIKLNESLLEEIKKRFNCEDYNAILIYVMKYVFESKNTKETCVTHMKEIFHEQSEEIVNILWELTQKIYNIEGSNDLLEEIYKDKNEKKFPSSQIINPNANKKNLFNSAIEKVSRESGENDNSSYRSKRKSSNDERRYDDDRRRDRRDDVNKVMTVGGKKIVTRKNRRSRSRSRSRSNERQDRQERPYRKGSDHYHEGDGYGQEVHNKDYRDNRDNNKYGNDYYMPRGGYYQRGARGFKRGFGGRFMMPRYMEPRRPMIRPPFRPLTRKDKPENPDEIQKSTEEGVNQQDSTNNIENPNPNPNQQGHPDKIVDKKKVRCKKWPTCKTEGCEYSHPSETCQFFPKCQFGDKCIYIHPNIPCKYGFYCTRVNCAYSHNAGFNPGMYPMPGMGMPFGGGPKFRNMKLDNSKKVISMSAFNSLDAKKGEVVEQQQVENLQEGGDVNANN